MGKNGRGPRGTSGSPWHPYLQHFLRHRDDWRIEKERMATREAVSYFSVWLWIMRSLFKNSVVICFLWSKFSLQNQLTSPIYRLFSCRSWREEIKEDNTHVNYVFFFNFFKNPMVVCFSWSELSMQKAADLKFLMVIFFQISTLLCAK